MVQTKADLASTTVRLNTVLIGKSDARTVMRGVVKKRIRAFRNAVVQMKSSFLVRFGKSVESAFGSVQQKSPVTVCPGSAVPEAKTTWNEASLDDTGPSDANGK